MNIEKLKPLSRGGWSTTKNWRVSDYQLVDFINENDAKALQAFITQIKDKMPTIKEGTNITIDKNSDIPRPKLKEFITDNKCKKVSKIDKADIIAIRRETISFIENLKLETKKIVDQADIQKIKDSGDIYQPITERLFLANWGDKDAEYLDVESRCSDLTGFFMSGYRNKKQIEQLEFVMSLVGTKKIVVFDDALLAEMNNDGLDLDDEIYETLLGMLLSKENETFNLGIEMLSNVNLENNLFKISVLLNSVHVNTHRLNALSQIKNKSFKALLNYVESNNIRWNQSWESFGMSMYSKFRDSEHERNIREYIIDNINNRFKRVNKHNVLKITNIIFE